MSYAIITLGGKQYRVQPGQRLLVDRLAHDEGATFEPRVLLLGGSGEADLAPAAGVVTVRVVRHVLGDKIRIGKYRQRTGYKRHNGFRARLSQIEIEVVAGEKAAPKVKAEPVAKKAPAKPTVEAAVAVAEAPVVEAVETAAAPEAEVKQKRTRTAKPKVEKAAEPVAEAAAAEATEAEASDGT